MPVTSVYRPGGGTGIISDPVWGRQGPKGDTGTPGVAGAFQHGNVLVVDAIYGNDTAANAASPYFTLPFQTVQAAVAKATSGTTIWVLPGTYTLTSGITIPDGCSIRGLSVQTCVLQMNVTSSTTMITMGANTRVEDLTINLTCTGSTNNVVLKGIVFPDAGGQSTSQTAKLRTSVVTVRNSAMSNTLTSAVIGIDFTGTGTFTTSSFSFNSVKGSTINVFSNGAGNKRGLLVSGTNQVSTRDVNVYVAQPTNTTSTGSYVGVETNSSGNGSIQLRTTTVGTVTPTGIEAYTASDVLQTTPASLDDPTYLATAGIQIGPGVDLVTKTAGGKTFSTYNYPTTLYYGLKGDLKTGGTNEGFMWPGTQKFENNVFPDRDLISPAFYRVQQPFILSGMIVAMKLKPPGTDGSITTTISVWRTPFATGTLELVTGFSLQLTGTDTFKSYYNSSVTFAAKDLIHVKIVSSDYNSTVAHDVAVQLDCF